MIWLSVIIAILGGSLAFGAGWLVAGALNMLAARLADDCIKQAVRKRSASSTLAARCGCFVRDNRDGA